MLAAIAARRMDLVREDARAVRRAPLRNQNMQTFYILLPTFGKFALRHGRMNLVREGSRAVRLEVRSAPPSQICETLPFGSIWRRQGELRVRAAGDGALRARAARRPRRRPPPLWGRSKKNAAGRTTFQLSDANLRELNFQQLFADDQI